MKQLKKIMEIASLGLPAAGINCIMIGGFAVNYYGYTRNTLDVDFMITADKIDIVRGIMAEAGFTNISVGDNVAFFGMPDLPWRVDFLRVDNDTMNRLLGQANIAEVQGYKLKVPLLLDLIAMKIFALSQSIARRMGKDLPDISYLIIIHNLDMEKDIRPLTVKYGTEEIFAMIRRQVEELRSK